MKPFFKAGNYQLQANQVAISQARQSVEMGPAIPTNQLLSIREGPVGSGRPEPSVAIPSDNAESPHRRTPWLWPAVRIALLLTGFAIAWMTLALNRTTKEGFLTLDHLPANAVLEVDGRPVPLQRKAAEPVTVRLRSGKRAVLVKRGNVKLADQNVLIESGKSFRLPMPVPEPGRPQTASQSGAFSKEPASAEPPVRSPQRTSIGVSDESRSPKPQQLGAAPSTGRGRIKYRASGRTPQARCRVRSRPSGAGAASQKRRSCSAGREAILKTNWRWVRIAVQRPGFDELECSSSGPSRRVECGERDHRRPRPTPSLLGHHERRSHQLPRSRRGNDRAGKCGVLLPSASDGERRVR